LDYNSFSGDQIFVNTNGTWTSTNDITGSLMIRPIFGKGENVTAAEESTEVGVYPNPSTGTFTIADPFETLNIYNVMGQPVSFDLYRDDNEQRITLRQPASGLYILHMTSGNKNRTAKVIVK
jgi:hypothetical protein